MAGEILTVNAGGFVGYAALSSGQLPASGVTAGTYGDATHVGQVTVDAAGRVTAASSVAITGGGGTAGLVSLFDSTLGVDAAAIDTGAGGIASGHGMLVLSMVLRTDEAAAISNATLTFNNDSGANYDTQDLHGTGATVAGAVVNAATSITCIVHGSGGSASYASVINGLIPAYDQTTFFKAGTYDAVANDATAGNNWRIDRGFTYRSTTAISRMAITAAGGQKLKAGSRLTVYGTQ